jgi:hypothetical protein
VVAQAYISGTLSRPEWCGLQNVIIATWNKVILAYFIWIESFLKRERYADFAAGLQQ